MSLVAVWFSARHTVLTAIKRLLWGAWSVFAIGLLSEAFHFTHGKWFMYLGSIALVWHISTTIAIVKNQKGIVLPKIRIDDTNTHAGQ